MFTNWLNFRLDENRTSKYFGHICACKLYIKTSTGRCNPSKALKCAFVVYFKHWYASEIQRQLEAGIPSAKVLLDFSIWPMCENVTLRLIEVREKQQVDKEMIVKGWTHCEILEHLNVLSK